MPAGPTNSEDIDEDLKSVLLDPSIIRAATQNFAEGNKLGEGGFGQVYKVITSCQSFLPWFLANLATYTSAKPQTTFCPSLYIIHSNKD